MDDGQAISDLGDIAGDDDVSCDEDTGDRCVDSQSRPQEIMLQAPAPPRAPTVPDAEVFSTIPHMIAGVPVKFVQVRHEICNHARIEVKCPNPRHVHTKSRSVMLGTDKWGPRAAEFFLGAWLAKSFETTEADHRAFRPKDADIAAYRDSIA